MARKIKSAAQKAHEARNNALRLIRSAFAFHLAGDQHLAAGAQ